MSDLQHVNPATLTLDGNIRTNTAIDQGLIDSITHLGVLQPITAWNDNGQLRVISGQRRTLAAIKAGRDTVPVYVVPQPEELELPLMGLVENTHRKALDGAEEAAGLLQASLFGVRADQIATVTGLTEERVKAAIAVGRSTTTPTIVEAVPTATLDQLAALVEFEADHETHADLAACLTRQPQMFDHHLSRARKDRAEVEAAEVVLGRLLAEGLRAELLTDQVLWDDKSPVRSVNGFGLAPKTHKKCPGRLILVKGRTYYGEDEPTVEEIECCDQWRELHKANSTSAEEVDEKALEERRKVRANNAAWVAAEPVRAEFLDELMTRAKLPEARVLIANALLIDYGRLNGHKVANLVDKWTGLGAARSYPVVPLSGWAKGTPGQIKKAEKVALAVALAAHESALSKDSWRYLDGANARYFDWLEAQGYVLSDVEKIAAGRDRA
ncbi:MAG: ParB N-terminal domain-containing protein [Propionibacteriaceae bacterium]|nr:ParB N-terminal domain-containing protein [Propionibacteriaceae bacterium]